MSSSLNNSYSQENSRRLETIENKIDKLTDIAVSIAVIEDKIENLNKDRNFIMGKILNFDKSCVVLETKIEKHELTLSQIKKFMWVVITSILTGFGSGSVLYFQNKTVHITEKRHYSSIRKGLKDPIFITIPQKGRIPPIESNFFGLNKYYVHNKKQMDDITEVLSPRP